MKKMNLKQKLIFKTIDDRILHMIKNNYYLEYAELEHIYNNMAFRVKPNYKKLCQSVMSLLDLLQNEELDALVKVLNTDFTYMPNWKIDITTLEDKFNTWTYNCNNPETSKFLISLASERETKKKNSSLNELKDLVNQDRER
jgi:BMFP domain-containing protein YqiC